MGQDRNVYTTGVLEGKAVVMVRDTDTRNAATLAGDVRCGFRNIKLGLMVGETGGAPQMPGGIDIHVRDVIISTAVI